jgi:internalin A
VDLLINGNSISDISPLSGLTSLTRLGLSGNSISDISVLSGLTSLTVLGLQSNSITDISVLSGLTSLIFLNVGFNSISDISALTGLTSLMTLYLYGNAALSNIQPLLDNTGLGAGDIVFLTSTNVSCTDVAALRAKGVTVVSPCV